MPWYRGVECKTCKEKLALKSLADPKKGPFDSPGLVIASITCPECRANNLYENPDFIVFETLQPITVPSCQIKT